MTVTVHSDRVVATSTSDSSTSVEVYFYGATVSSWKQNGQEQLFLSSKAVLNGTKAIRGGIPLVFPQFGTVPGSTLPQHGFARTSRWQLHGYEDDDHSNKKDAGGKAAAAGSGDQKNFNTSGCIQLHFQLSPKEVSPSLWEAWASRPFQLVYHVTLDPHQRTLTTVLAVHNPGSEPFDFTWLLHTYLRVRDVSHISIEGLDGKSYEDKTKGGAISKQVGGVTIKGEVDWVFAGVPIHSGQGKEHGLVIMDHHSPNHPAPYISVERLSPSSASQQAYHQPHHQHQPGGAHALTRAFTDVVVWNPGPTKAKGMSDFGGEEEVPHMVCVEVGDVAKPISVKPGEWIRAGQRLWSHKL